jgi:hypothetical protein
MPTLELDFTEADEVVNEAANQGGAAETQAAWLNAFYQNAERRLLNLYDRARLGAWRIYDREQVAAYWQEQTKWFENMLRNLERSQEKVSSFGLPEIPALRSASQTVREIVEACRGSYELFA